MKKIIEKIRLEIVNKTSDTSKSRKLFKRIYYLFPNRIRKDNFLENYLKKVSTIEQIRFIQIGCNDGVYRDPLYKFVKKKKWMGLMIEPNPIMMSKLKENHKKSLSRLIFVDKAIGEEGSFTLFWCKEDTGMASTQKDHVKKHIGKRGFAILEQRIEMISFTNLVENYVDFSNVDILLLDTEGWDGKILDSIDFTRFNTDIIIFENDHIDEIFYSQLIQKLSSIGYVDRKSNTDTLLVKRKPSDNRFIEFFNTTKG